MHAHEAQAPDDGQLVTGESVTDALGGESVTGESVESVTCGLASWVAPVGAEKYLVRVPPPYFPPTPPTTPITPPPW